MKRKDSVIFLTLLSLACFGCKEYDDFISSTKLELKGDGLKGNILSFDNSLTQGMEIICNDIWKITGIDTSWVSIKEGEIILKNDSVVGKGNGEVRFIADKPEVKDTEEMKPRECPVKVISGDRTYSITLSQNPQKLEFHVEERNGDFSFEEEGDTCEILVMCNTEWKAESDKSWCYLDTMSGTGMEQKQKRLLICKPNDKEENKSATITIYPVGYKEKYRWIRTVNQFAKTYIRCLGLEEVCFESNAVNDTLTFEISSNTKWESKILKHSNWFSYDNLSGEGNKKITVKCKLKHESQKERVDTIRFMTGKRILDVPIVQKPEYSILINNGGGEQIVKLSDDYFVIKSNVKWKLINRSPFFDLRIDEASLTYRGNNKSEWSGVGDAIVNFIDVKDFSNSTEQQVIEIQSEETDKCKGINVTVLNE